jgi:hypothetical protein
VRRAIREILATALGVAILLAAAVVSVGVVKSGPRPDPLPPLPERKQKPPGVCDCPPLPPLPRAAPPVPIFLRPETPEPPLADPAGEWFPPPPGWEHANVAIRVGDDDERLFERLRARVDRRVDQRLTDALEEAADQADGKKGGPYAGGWTLLIAAATRFVLSVLRTVLRATVEASLADIVYTHWQLLSAIVTGLLAALMFAVRWVARREVAAALKAAGK